MLRISPTISQEAFAGNSMNDSTGGGPNVGRFIGGVFGLVFAGIGLTVIIFLWGAPFGEFGSPPVIFRIFGSFIAIAFVAMGGGAAFAAITGKGGGGLVSGSVVGRMRELQAQGKTLDAQPGSEDGPVHGWVRLSQLWGRSVGGGRRFATRRCQMRALRSLVQHPQGGVRLVACRVLVWGWEKRLTIEGRGDVIELTEAGRGVTWRSGSAGCIERS